MPRVFNNSFFQHPHISPLNDCFRSSSAIFGGLKYTTESNLLSNLAIEKLELSSNGESCVPWCQPWIQCPPYGLFLDCNFILHSSRVDSRERSLQLKLCCFVYLHNGCPAELFRPADWLNNSSYSNIPLPDEASWHLPFHPHTHSKASDRTTRPSDYNTRTHIKHT